MGQIWGWVAGSSFNIHPQDNWSKAGPKKEAKGTQLPQIVGASGFRENIEIPYF